MSAKNNGYRWTTKADGVVKHHDHWCLAIEALIEAAPLTILREGESKKSLEKLQMIALDDGFKERILSYPIGLTTFTITRYEGK